MYGFIEIYVKEASVKTLLKNYLKNVGLENLQ